MIISNMKNMKFCNHPSTSYQRYFHIGLEILKTIYFLEKYSTTKLDNVYHDVYVLAAIHDVD